MLRESIAIVGGGYGGIGCAYHLRRSCSRYRGRVRLLDQVLPLPSNSGTGGGAAASGWSASSVSVGMVHPLSSSGKMLPLGELAFDVAKSSIGYAMGDAQLDGNGCIAKIFMSHAESDKFMRNAKAHSQWIEAVPPPDEASTSRIFRGAVGALRMRGSLVINTEEFIRRFWDNFKLEMGGALEVSESAVTDLQCLSQQHDVVVIAAGAGLMQLWGAPLPMLSCVKGQSLIYPGACVSAPVPAAWPWLRSALVPGGYVVWKGGGGGGASDSGKMEGQEEQVVIGATYEHGVDINGSEFCPADGPLAMDLLLRRGRLSSSLSEQFISALTSSSSGGGSAMPPPAVRAAYRVTVAPSPRPSPGSRGAGALPVILRHHSLRNVFAVTGFASRGLLYHALTGNFLIRAFLDGDFNTIPHNMYIDTI